MPLYSTDYLFHWGLARLAHEMELNRQVYQDIRQGILYPAATQAKEYRERGETALENGWWEEAVQDLERALAENPIDFLAHYHLGHVLWFRYGQWEPALEHFRAAAKYADSKRAGEKQKYYAALAYTHVSLLWRMHAETHPKEAAQGHREAYTATRRAVELDPDLMMARVEHAANCWRVGSEPEAVQLINEDARREKALLAAYQTSPDLKGWPSFPKHLLRARHNIESIEEENERLRREADAREQERLDRELREKHRRENEAKRRSDLIELNARYERELETARGNRQAVAILVFGVGVVPAAICLMISWWPVAFMLSVLTCIVVCAAWRGYGPSVQSAEQKLKEAQDQAVSEGLLQFARLRLPNA